MLSFLREQGYRGGLEDSSSGKGAAEAQEADGNNQGYLSVATQQKDVRKSTIMLCVLFGVGLLCLFFMIRKSSPQSAGASQLVGAGAEETQIEIAIARLTGVRSEMFEGIEEIVKKFYEFSEVRQVGADELVKNPFKTDRSLGDVKQASDGGKKSDIDAQMLRRRRLQQQAKGMQLLSIMATDAGNCCMIDNKIFYEGDSIRDFKIVRIGSCFVKLASEDVEVILNLSQ